MLNAIFTYQLCKSKNSLLVRKNNRPILVQIGLFIKVKWHSVNFQKLEHTCTIILPGTKLKQKRERKKKLLDVYIVKWWSLLHYYELVSRT